MKSLHIKESRGAISTALLIAALIIVVLIIVVFAIIKINAIRTAGDQPKDNPDGAPAEPVYDTTLDPIRFVFISAKNLGSKITSTKSYVSDITTTDNFIKVTIGAQNKGKVNTEKYAWDLGDIIDSEGRHFIAINNKAYYYLPVPDLCGEVLNPEFQLTPCVRFYEASKESKDLKIEIKTSSQSSLKGKKNTALLDLIVE